MYRLLIADSEDTFVNSVYAALEKRFEIASCTDGVQVLELVRIFQPDMLLLDLQMPGMDGLSILENIHDAGYKPAVLVTARLMTDYVEYSLERLKVDYAIMKPCNLSCVVRRIEDVLKQRFQNVAVTHDKKETIERLLLALGFRPSLIGFRCIVEAIALMADTQDLAITKQVYPAVAEICGSSETQVEHAIRLAIADAWKHRDDAVWSAYFSKNMDGVIRRPTNAVLLSHLAACVRTRIQQK